MLAVVSHDLRSPLNAVMGWAHLLRETVKEPIAVRAVEAIQRSAEAQRRLIEDLLDFVRIEAGALRLEPRDVDLGEVIRASVDSIRPAAGTKHIALEVSIDARASVVWADPARLQQATDNLLANALRFTPENGHVAVRVAREDGGVSIRVQDSGPGIPPDVLPHLFTALEETPARPGARGDGLGLGLAISRHIVELHGGTIEAANEPGNRGAFFMIVLPLGPRGRPTDPAA